MPSGLLFPEAPAPSASPQVDAIAGAATPRPETIAESEPNDSATQAQPIGLQAMVRGQLWAGAGQQDRDWYRLPAIPPGHAMTLDLRESPSCAVLELLDDAGVRVSRKAGAWRATRPVLPAQTAGQGVSLVRVTCKGKPLTEAGDSAYVLLATTRPLGPSDEWERNDTAGADAQVLALDAPLAGTLAPIADIDRFALPGGAAEGTRWVLTAVGLPDVAMELAVRDPLSGDVLLQRRASQGGGLLVAGLDPTLLRAKDGRMALVELSAEHGQAPDADYALTLRLQKVEGCARADGCPEAQPDDREPNDTLELAQRWSMSDPSRSASWRGWLDGELDEDWLAPERPLSATLVQLTLTAPPEVPLAMEWWEGAVLQAKLEVDAGTSAGWAAVPCSQQTRWKVRSRKGNVGGAYRLEVATVNAALFETEALAGRGRPAAAASAPLLAIAAGELGCDEGGFGRRGVLLEASDRDSFVWSHQGPAWTGELRCAGDGRAGLRCVLRDASERVVAELLPPARGEATPAPLRLEAGTYHLEVSATAPRSSLEPYLVALASDADLAAVLPVAATPSAEPVPGTPAAAPRPAAAPSGRPPAASAP